MKVKNRVQKVFNSYPLSGNKNTKRGERWGDEGVRLEDVQMLRIPRKPHNLIH